MALLRHTVDEHGRPRPGQLRLALLEIAIAYLALACILFFNGVRHTWLAAAIALLGLLGVAYLLERLDVLSGKTLFLFNPNAVDVMQGMDDRVAFAEETDEEIDEEIDEEPTP